MPAPLKFRFKAFGWHLAASACALSLVLGGLYLGWYRWPGWYLAGALGVLPVLVSVDLALGPLVTLLIANPAKPRRELARDITIIVAVQLVALLYGAGTLWQGRPLYYAFSEDRLQLVQASDLSDEQVALARQLNPGFAPHWYSLPRWVWAPLPEDAAARQQIIDSSIAGGDDVIQMPSHFRPWQEGLPALRAILATVGGQRDFRVKARLQSLRARMQAAGLPVDEPAWLLFTGREWPLLAQFGPSDTQPRAYATTRFEGKPDPRP
jgi:hypothetical protein